jgi:hypothetical protein
MLVRPSGADGGKESGNRRGTGNLWDVSALARSTGLSICRRAQVALDVIAAANAARARPPTTVVARRVRTG